MQEQSMRTVSSVGIGLSIITASLLLALLAEIYYLLWWKKRRASSNHNNESNRSSLAREFLYMFCWKRPSSLSSSSQNLKPAHSDSSDAQVHIQPNYAKELQLKSYEAEESIDVELMRLHSLAGPPRFLFTIKEETKEDLESEDGRKRGKSLSDFLASPHVFTPPLTPLSYYKQAEFNPLFEVAKDDCFSRTGASPPPKFKFLRDAEEKLYQNRLKEESDKVQSINNGGEQNEKGEDGSFITIIIGKSRDRGAQFNHSVSSQVIPLHSSPMSFTATNKTASPLQGMPSPKNGGRR